MKVRIDVLCSAVELNITCQIDGRMVVHPRDGQYLRRVSQAVSSGLNDNNPFTASVCAIYSASITESATVDCRCVVCLQPLQSVNTQPVVDLLVFVSPAHFESQQPASLRAVVLP